MTRGVKYMNLSEIFNENAIAVDIPADSKIKALEYLTKLLYKDQAIGDESEFLKDVLIGEGEGQTGIGDGIAIPHGKSGTVRKDCIAFGKLKQPVTWESVDDKPVSVIFLFAVNKNTDADNHLRMMAMVARALADEEICRRIKEVETKEDVFVIINEITAAMGIAAAN